MAMSKYDYPSHEAAEKFPLMSEPELKALADNIKARGQDLPIVLLNGKVLDGRNRLVACKFARVEPWTREATKAETADPEGFVMAMNLHRRHLTKEQKNAAIRWKLKAAPEKSNRAIAAEVQVDHKTVAAERAELEDGGEIPHHEKHVGQDGVEQPARKKPDAPLAVAPKDPPELAALKAADLEHKQFRDLVYALRDIRRHYLEVKPRCVFLSDQSIEAHLKGAEHEILHSQPYAICPYCHGKGNCKYCCDCGWVPKSKFNSSVPPEFKIGAVTL